jgi:hypothetical protein
VTARGEGLARWRAERAAVLWPKVQAALNSMLLEHGAPNRFFFSEIAQRAGITARELGSVLRSGGAAAVWLRERAAVIEVQGRQTALVFGDADDAPGAGAPGEPDPQLPLCDCGEPTCRGGCAPDSGSDDWQLPSLF